MPSAPALELPSLRLTMNQVQVIATATTTELSFDTASYSGGGWVLPTAPVTDITFPFTGKVRLDVHDMDWQDTGNATGVRRLLIKKNGVAGSIRAGLQSFPTGLQAGTLVQTVQSFSVVLSVTKDDYIGIFAYQSSGGNLSPALNDLYIQYISLGAATFTGTN